MRSLGVWKQACDSAHTGTGQDRETQFLLRVLLWGAIMQFNHVPMLFVKCESNFLSGNSIFHTHVENNLKSPGGLPVFKNSGSVWQGNVSIFAQSSVPLSKCREMELSGGLLLGDTSGHHPVWPSAEVNPWLGFSFQSLGSRDGKRPGSLASLRGALPQ